MKNIISLIKLELEDSYNKSNKKNYALKIIIALIVLGGIAISFCVYYNNRIFIYVSSNINYGYFCINLLFFNI